MLKVSDVAMEEKKTKKRIMSIKSPDQKAKEYVEEERRKEQVELDKNRKKAIDLDILENLISNDFKVTPSTRDLEDKINALQRSIIESHKLVFDDTSKSLSSHQRRIKTLEDQLFDDRKQIKLLMYDLEKLKVSYNHNMEDIESSIKQSWSYRIRTFFGF